MNKKSRGKRLKTGDSENTRQGKREKKATREGDKKLASNKEKGKKKGRRE